MEHGAVGRTKDTPPTFGIRKDDGRDGGAPVGDLDGEISLPELIHAHHLPPRCTGATGKAHEAQRDEKRHSSHCYLLLLGGLALQGEDEESKRQETVMGGLCSH